MTDAVLLARASIAHHSKSFSLASRLLPARCRDDARVVYAWCRRADDAIDLAPQESIAAALAALWEELAVVYERGAHPDPIVDAFGRVARARGIPEEYPRALLSGMRMDAEATRYETWDDLLLYCYRVAGAVGLMMCHLLGVRRAEALRNAAHLGIAMQLTNIARDVAEDWERGRLYLPNELLATCGAARLADELGGPLPTGAHEALRRALEGLLNEADRYYESADAGLAELDLQSAWAVGTARAVYSDIGRVLAKQSFAVEAGRARVPTARKLVLALRAGWTALASRGAGVRFRPVPLRTPLRFPDDILPV